MDREFPISVGDSRAADIIAYLSSRGMQAVRVGDGPIYIVRINGPTTSQLCVDNGQGDSSTDDDSSGVVLINISDSGPASDGSHPLCRALVVTVMAVLIVALLALVIQASMMRS